MEIQVASDAIWIFLDKFIYDICCQNQALCQKVSFSYLNRTKMPPK
jgi:hypothetical protein